MNGTGGKQGRDEGGRFKPGTSGNPAGRPPGRPDKRTQAREELLGPLLPKAIEKLSKAVEESERWAVELVVAYSLPKPRPVDPDELDELERRLSELEEVAARRS